MKLTINLHVNSVSIKMSSTQNFHKLNRLFIFIGWHPIRRRGMVGRVPVFQPVGPGSIPSGVGNFNFCPGIGCVSFVFCLMLSPAEVLTLCWLHIHEGPPLCICLVFCPKIVAPPTGIWPTGTCPMAYGVIAPSFFIWVIMKINFCNLVNKFFPKLLLIRPTVLSFLVSLWRWPFKVERCQKNSDKNRLIGIMI